MTKERGEGEGEARARCGEGEGQGGGYPSEKKFIIIIKSFYKFLKPQKKAGGSGR